MPSNCCRAYLTNNSPSGCSCNGRRLPITMASCGIKTTTS
jgi:hypothetical protein